MAVCGLLLVAVGLVFGQDAVYPFVNWDDPACVYENPHVQKGLTLETLGWAFGDRCAGSWVPLTWISHVLDWQIYGDRGGGHHLTNLLLHAATTVLLFLVLRRMTGRIWPSALVAAVFAIHPLRVESVAWVTERKDVLSGLFYVLTLAAYAGYVRRPGSLPRYLLVLASFAMGLMSKPSLVAMPFLLLLLDYWPLGRFSGQAGTGESTGPGVQSRARGDHREATAPDRENRGSPRERLPRALLPTWLWLVVEKLPLLGLSAASSIVTVWAQGTALGINVHYPVLWRIGNAFVSYLFYLGSFFFPANLGPVYVRLPKDFPPEQAIIALLVLVAITLLAWIWRRTRPYLLVGWLWYLGTMFPAIGLVQFGVQSVADRFTYFTQIGLAIALAWAAADLLRAFGSGADAQPSPSTGSQPVNTTRFQAVVLSVLVLTLLSAGAWRQTSYWADPQTLWTHALACGSDQVVAHTSLGDVFAAKSRWTDAIAQYDAALRLNPKCVEAAANRGVVLRHMDRVDDAIAQYKKAIAIKDTPETRYVLAAALVQQRRLPEAVEQYVQSLNLKDDGRIRAELASLLSDMGRTEEALAQYELSLKVKPDDARTHALLGSLLARLDRAAQAVPHFREAIRLDPKSAQAHYELAEILREDGIATGNGSLISEAIEQYRAALETSPNDVLARTNLGVTLMLCGHAGEAIEQCNRRWRSAPIGPKPKTAWRRATRRRAAFPRRWPPPNRP